MDGDLLDRCHGTDGQFSFDFCNKYAAVETLLETMTAWRNFHSQTGLTRGRDPYYRYSRMGKCMRNSDTIVVSGSASNGAAGHVCVNGASCFSH